MRVSISPTARRSPRRGGGHFLLLVLSEGQVTKMRDRFSPFASLSHLPLASLHSFHFSKVLITKIPSTAGPPARALVRALGLCRLLCNRVPRDELFFADPGAMIDPLSLSRRCHDLLQQNHCPAQKDPHLGPRPPGGPRAAGSSVRPPRVAVGLPRTGAAVLPAGGCDGGSRS